MPGRRPVDYHLRQHLTDADAVFCEVYDFIDARLVMTVAVDQPGLVGQVFVRPVPFCYFAQPAIHEIVDFVDPADWRDYVVRNSNGVCASALIPRMEAITHQYEGRERRAIGVQVGYYTRGTLVHEFFHYFSHATFRTAFNPGQNEGLTEWLARRILGGGERHDTHGHGNFYGPELEGWDVLGPGDVTLVLKAYVLGDLASIAALQRMLTMYQSMMSGGSGGSRKGGKGKPSDRKL